MKQTFVIGDIHGGLKALEQLLTKIPLKENDTIIFLGDYLDGWSDVAALIDYLMELDKTQDCIFLKGNHDMWCLQWLQTGMIDKLWYASGGEATIKSYEKVLPTQKKDHINFFERLKNYYIDSENRLFIHAGFAAVRGPAHEHYESNYTWDRTLWETAIAVDLRIDINSLFFPKRLKLFKEIYIGHTPTTNYNIEIPMHGYNVWNIDTGAAFNGKLTAIDIDSKQFWQSDPVFSFYPNEKG